jgi:hypothetical protein
MHRPFSFIDGHGRESTFTTAAEMATFVGKIRPNYRAEMEAGIDYTNWPAGKYSSVAEFHKLYSWSDSIIKKNTGKKS